MVIKKIIDTSQKKSLEYSFIGERSNCFSKNIILSRFNSYFCYPIQNCLFYILADVKLIYIYAYIMYILIDINFELNKNIILIFNFIFLKLYKSNSKSIYNIILVLEL